MSVDTKRRKKQRRTSFAYIRQFGYEIVVIMLMVLGSFLIVEKTDVSAVLLNWIKIGFNFITNGVTAFAHNASDYFISWETSDIVGYFLILLAFHLIIIRGRKRLFREYGTVYKCSHCEHEKMQRIKRKFWHKLVGAILIMRIKHYQCKACKKGTIAFSPSRRK